MILIPKNILFLMIIFFSFSCGRINEENHHTTIDLLKNKEEADPLGSLNKNDTLKILVEFSDCGEWGGHNEYIYLKRDSLNRITAQYIIDSISCENIIIKQNDNGAYSDLDDNTRVIKLDITKILNKQEEKLISSFLQRLLDIYLQGSLYDKLYNDYCSRVLNGSDVLADEMEDIIMYIDAGSVLQVINTDKTLNITYFNVDERENTNYGKIRKQIFGDIIGNKTKQ